jgi:light-regulated signal transduction histidine kinase (bacteriophytochrome)
VDVTSRKRSWLVVAIAILLMALRRTISLISYVSQSREIQLNTLAELVALATSALLVIGLSGIAPLFKSMQKAKEELERQTNQLDELNEELKSFSYSVSHDLKTPVRHIEGYIKLIQDKLGDKLDEEGRDYIARIQHSSVQMSHLINNLLRFSQETSGGINRDTVNLSELTAKILDQLKADQPDRKVEVKIAQGVFAEGDPELLHVVLENLLGNAWKFTTKEEQAVIEFGSCEQDGKTAYFVRDNGIGFDQTRSREIFKPFKRLHTAPEFAGTGIGLATAARIIRRHGGRIRAESTPGEGATFYFSV